MSSGEAELCAVCMAREFGVHLDARELQVDANAAIGIIGRQGLVKLRHLTRGCSQFNLKKVQPESNMADIGTKALDLHMKNFGLRTIRPVESRTYRRGGV